MSEQSAKAFVKKLASDPAFRSKVDAASTDADKQAVAKAAGFDFNKTEVQAVMAKAPSGKLSDKDLESVAGGKAVEWTGVAIGVVGASASAAA